MLEDPEFNVFYNAGTLIIICARNSNSGAAEDCSLAAENLMLAAVDLGLATCPIGFARPLLNEASVKRELNIPDAYDVVFPVILGYSASEVPAVPRREPEILTWKKGDNGGG
jgi:nitroreductase